MLYLRPSLLRYDTQPEHILALEELIKAAEENEFSPQLIASLHERRERLEQFLKRRWK